MRIVPFRLSASELEALGAGETGPAEIETLVGAEYSRNALLLRFVLEHLPDRLEPAKAALVTAWETAPMPFAALLVEPMVAAWLSCTAGRLARHLRAGSAQPVADLAHAASVALVAAVRCGTDAEVVATPIDGLIRLPTVGTAPTVESSLPLRVRKGELGHELPGRSDVRPLAGRLVIDDLDPYRNMYGTPPADRLSSSSYLAWRRQAGAAWQLLEDHLPGRAAELTRAMRVVVPLVDPGSGKSISVTARQGFGAFGLTRPSNRIELTATLVHEFQHSKLNAVLDLAELLDGTDNREDYFAPWREDPRPLSGILHGTYAYLGILQFWNELRTVPEFTVAAHRHLAETRLWVRTGLAQVQNAAALTAAGQHFAAGMRQALDVAFEVDLPHPAVIAGERSLRRLQDDWRRRNQR